MQLQRSDDAILLYAAIPVDLDCGRACPVLSRARRVIIQMVSRHLSTVVRRQSSVSRQLSLDIVVRRLSPRCPSSVVRRPSSVVRRSSSILHYILHAYRDISGSCQVKR